MLGQQSFHHKPESDPFKNNYTKTVLCYKTTLSYNEVSLPQTFLSLYLPSLFSFMKYLNVPSTGKKTPKHVPKRPS